MVGDQPSKAPEPIPSKITDAVSVEQYKQGSELCRLYIQQTTVLRTFSQHVLLAYAVGIGIMLSRTERWPPPHKTAVLFSVGVVLCFFAWSLWTISAHFTRAFVGVRDMYLVPTEGDYDKDKAPKGPWQAHKKTREQGGKSLERRAGRLPFILLLVAGFLSIVAAFAWQPSPA
ncbi:MAG: hypothetical protein U1E73_03020 [Planctomycetota bacterium]